MDHLDPNQKGTPDDSVWNLPSAAPASSYDDPADLASMGIITVGDLLSTTARAIGGNLAAFVGIVVVVTLPGALANVAWQEWLYARMERMYDDPYAVTTLSDLNSINAAVGVGSWMLQLVLGFLANAMLMYATVELLAGRKAGIGRSVAAGLSSVGPVIALAFLNTIAIFAGTLACIIPGVVLTCVLFVAVPAAVVERIGPIAAMQRSAQLTEGHRWTIFLSLLVVVLGYLAIACTIGFGLGAVGLAADADPLSTSSVWQRVVTYALDFGLSLPLAIFQAALAGVFYARVRGVRDGVDAETIARAFE